MWDITEEARAKSKMTFSIKTLEMDMQVIDDKLERIYNSSDWTEDVVYKTCRKRWMIEMNGKKEVRKSVQASWRLWWFIWI